MKLSPPKFNKLLNNMGQAFLWRKSFVCPCVNPKSGQPQIGCAICDSKGRFWSDPVPGLAGVVGREVMKKQLDIGLFDSGDMMLSLPSDSTLYQMGMYDRLDAVNRTEPFSLNLVSGINDILRFKPLSVDRVCWLDADNVLIDGDIPVVQADGTLVWGTVAPPIHVTYSLTGRRYQNYYCYQEMPLDRPMHQGEPLPRRVVVRRFDLFGN